MISSLKHLLKAFSFILILSILLLFIDRQNRTGHSDKASGHPLKKVSIALVTYVHSPGTAEISSGILEGLNTLKVNDGLDYDLDSYCADGEVPVLNSIVGSLEAKRYDYILTTSTATLQSVIARIKDIPVIFNFVADPVAAGAGKSYDEHLPNVTGISTFSDFAGMATLVSELMPDLKTAGTLFNPSEINSLVYKEHLFKAMNLAGITMVAVPAYGPNEIHDAAISLVHRNIGAICQIHDNLSETGRTSIIMAAKNAGIPFFGFVNTSIKEGAMAVVSRDFVQAGRDGTILLRRVMKGEPISTIPFENVSKTITLINPDIAKKYGITIPEKWMKQTVLKQP